MTTQIKGNATSTFGGNVDVTGNVVTDAPAFSAYLGSNQAISSGTFTKCSINTEEFDTNSNYDTTNYRFTPTVEGYYQVSGQVNVQTAGSQLLVAIYKNGSSFKWGANSTNYIYNATISTLMYLNGSTDYIELYVYSGNSNTMNSGATNVWFTAHLARAV